jgi:hypothetical protein
MGISGRMGVWIWRSKERIWRRLCSSESYNRRDAKIIELLELRTIFIVIGTAPLPPVFPD